MIEPWYTYDINELIPENAVRAGVDIDGQILFAGRTFHSTDLLPAKIYLDHPQYGTAAHVSFDGREIPKRNFDILLPDGLYVWRTEENGEVPYRALEVGHTHAGEQLYLGRGKHQGAIIPGKIHPSHNCLYLAFSGREVAVRQYEVLCFR